MNKKQIIILIVVLTLLGVGGTYYYFWLGRVNYLIPSVSYNGIYNLFFQGAAVDSSEISSILNILGYWGDKRFAASDLAQKFPTSRFATSTPVSPMTLKSEVQNFFMENGYETSEWLSVKPDNVIEEIKQFVNSKKKTPVIVLSKRTLDERNNVHIFMVQIVIGVFDNSQKVIVHDHYYGNNYEITYGDFVKLFQAGTGILAVWPSDKIKGSIAGPNYNATYPQRLEGMDKAGTLLATKYLLALQLWRRGFHKESIAVYKEFFNDPNCKYLPPVFQVVRLSSFAKLYIGLNQTSEAIKIIKEQVLPLNKNLSQAPQGWIVPDVDESIYPYYVLSLAYLKEGKRNLAIDSYKELARIHDLAINKFGNQSITSRYLIEELEKEISSKK